MHKRTLLLIVGLGALGAALAVSPAEAHDQFPRSYYGGGTHDVQPHWHRTQTPFGEVWWYGMGEHDFRPHHHEIDPSGVKRGYHWTPFGPTESFHPHHEFRRRPHSRPHHPRHRGPFNAPW